VLDALKGFDGTESLRQVTAPTLVVAGSKDRAGLAAAQQLVSLVSGAELSVIDGAGSMLNAEVPRELADVTEDFLSRG
jgi:3-oxoadipate enol-lactonase